MTNSTVFVATGKTFDAKTALKAAGFRWNALCDGAWATTDAPASTPSGVTVVEVAPFTRAEIIAIMAWRAQSERIALKNVDVADAIVAGEELLDATGKYYDTTYTMTLADLAKARSFVVIGQRPWDGWMWVSEGA